MTTDIAKVARVWGRPSKVGSLALENEELRRFTIDQAKQIRALNREIDDLKVALGRKKPSRRF